MDLRAATLSSLLLALLSSCGEFPRDAEETLRKVEAGRPLRVGWSSAAPWVHGNGAGQPAGIEADIVRSFAASRGVRVEWVEAGEAQIVEGLNGNSLDVGIAGFTDQAPHGGLIGQTQPYLKITVVIGAVQDAGTPGSWEGVRVSYDPARPDFAALLLAEKAIPTAGPAPYKSVYEPELTPLGLRAAGKPLRTERRTIATAPSENALTLALDRFLHANKAGIRNRLVQEARQ
jgi:ABC-type amino acid transport substrate-binding protein